MANNVMNETDSNLGNIRYTVVENGAASKAKGEPVYTAVVTAKETYNIADIAARMTAEGCTVRPATIKMVLSDFAELAAKLVAEGRAVNIGGVVRFAPAIRGTFTSPEDVFDPARHQVVVNATIGNRLRSSAATSSVQRVQNVTLPKIDALFNTVDGSEGTICSKGMFVLTGSRLIWDDTQEDEGFIINLMGVETKCRTILGDPTGKRLVLRTTQPMNPGDAPELWFYTRINGGLYQIKYNGALICVEAPTSQA